MKPDVYQNGRAQLLEIGNTEIGGVDKKAFLSFMKNHKDLGSISPDIVPGGKDAAMIIIDGSRVEIQFMLGSAILKLNGVDSNKAEEARRIFDVFDHERLNSIKNTPKK